MALTGFIFLVFFVIALTLNQIVWDIGNGMDAREVVAGFYAYIITFTQFTLSLLSYEGAFQLDGSSTATLYNALFYSTYMTSIWVWLYFVGLSFTKLLLILDQGIRILDKFQIEKQPFRVVGFATSAAIFVLFLPLSFVLL